VSASTPEPRALAADARTATGPFSFVVCSLSVPRNMPRPGAKSFTPAPTKVSRGNNAKGADRIDTQCGSRMYNAPLAALETPAEQRCDSRRPPFPAATALLASPPFALKVCPPRRPHPLLAPRALHLRVVLLPGCPGVLASGDRIDRCRECGCVRTTVHNGRTRRGSRYRHVTDSSESVLRVRGRAGRWPCLLLPLGAP
jgi:hypothetical protein